MDGFNVQAPDGKVIQFPPSMAQSDVQAAMQKLYPPKSNLTAQNAKIDQMQADNPQPKPYYGFTPENVLSNIFKGAKGMVSGASGLAGDLISNPDWATGPNSTLQKFVINPADQEKIKAGQELNKGNRVAAGGHALASALPFIGPWAANLGQQSGEGDVGGAAGQAVGALGLAKLASKAPKALDALPSTARAGAAFQDVMSKAKNVPIDTTKFSDSLLAVKDLADRGGSMPMAVNKLLRRVTTPNTPPLTYEEARDFYSNITRLSANERMRLTPVIGRAVGQLANDFDMAIQDAASSVGKGPNYQSAMKEYAQGAKLKGAVSDAGDYAWEKAKQMFPWLAAGYAIKKGTDVFR